jgi:alpha-galactosidase
VPAALGPPLSAATLTTLSNPEVIAVDQDPLDACGLKIATGIYAKPLGTFTSGTYAVLILNRNSSATSFTVNWSDLGLLPGTATVRDLWAHQNLGYSTNSFTASNLASHDSMMLIISGAFDWGRLRTYEAEWAFNTCKGTAHSISNDTNFSSSAYVTGIGPGAANTLQFNQVAAPSNAVYQVMLYYACSAAHTAQIGVNGGAPITVSFPASGGNTTVAGIPAYLRLAAGTNTLLFSNATEPAPNLDKMVVSLGDPSSLQSRRIPLKTGTSP